MSKRHYPRARAALVTLTVAPVLGVTLTVSGATPGAAADADINLIGGKATSAVVCGNVAQAQQLAQQRHVALQRSHCTATAAGGDVALRNVEISIPRAAGTGGRGNAALAALASGSAAAGVAGDNCAQHRPAGTSGRSFNECTSSGRGGRALLDHVTLVNHQADGTTTSRTVNRLAMALDRAGGASADCRNVVSDPLNQRDDCDAAGEGGSWNLNGVDVVTHNADGSTSTRRGINVTVRGGDATASTFCFNVTDGSSRVVQLNVCRASAQAGNATLSNVTVHTYAVSP